ncbi:MAG: hypothetical protein ABI406_21185, partial [Ktedonobacteraceae bacterium]
MKEFDYDNPLYYQQAGQQMISSTPSVAASEQTHNSYGEHEYASTPAVMAAYSGPTDVEGYT